MGRKNHRTNEDPVRDHIITSYELRNRMAGIEA